MTTLLQDCSRSQEVKCTNSKYKKHLETMHDKHTAHNFNLFSSY